MIIHIVKKDDSIDSIAKMYDVTVEQIREDNDLQSPQRLMIGQAIAMRKVTNIHIVSEGQTLYDIAELYHTNVPRLIVLNPSLQDPSKLMIDQEIVVPAVTKPFGIIEVNGYVHPNVDREVLTKTFPHLTYLSIFSHEVRPDGSITSIDDAELITLAKEAKVAPFMVITNINEEGNFDTDLAHTILSDPGIQDTLIANVLEKMEHNYTGLAVDFEFIRQADRENYNNFLRKVVEQLHPLGYLVSTAVAPKISGTQKGLLYEAHDYPVHGETVDHVILMTYEWGYTYGPAQPVAPIDQVERVIQYAVSVIPNKKILMGIPNYGYDWTLPFKKGSAAANVSNTGAIALAARIGARIDYDEKTQTPFFTYYDDNKHEHIVWFEDARSTQAKLELVDKYNLGGISIWTLANYFPQFWLVLESMYTVKKIPIKE